MSHVVPLNVSAPSNVATQSHIAMPPNGTAPSRTATAKRVSSQPCFVNTTPSHVPLPRNVTAPSTVAAPSCFAAPSNVATPRVLQPHIGNPSNLVLVFQCAEQTTENLASIVGKC